MSKNKSEESKFEISVLRKLIFSLVIVLVVLLMIILFLNSNIPAARASVAVEFLRVVISFPSVLFFGMLIFRKEIKSFLENLEWIKTPVGEMHRRDLVMRSEAVELESEKVKKEESEINSTQKELEKLKEELTNSHEKRNSNEKLIRDLTKLVREYDERANNFEFRYLDMALPQNFRSALMWFRFNSSSKEPVSLDLYMKGFKIINNTVESHLSRRFQDMADAETKNNILRTLINHGLIKEDNNRYSITEKGNSFIGRFRTGLHESDF